MYDCNKKDNSSSGKNSKLNILFCKWKDNDVYKGGQFIRDGIINEELYDKAKIKILFIEKESNDNEGENWDYRQWWNEETLQYTFTYRLAEWSYGILNDFEPYDNVWKNEKNAHDVFRQVAFMNVKKSGGGGVSDYDEILTHIKKDRTNLLKEIEIINPDIIILGLSYMEHIKALFGNLDFKESGYNIKIARYKKAKVIDFYHPSSRIPGAASYSLLQNVVLSKPFKNL